MKSFILFLAGGKWQVPWISYLKQRGHNILLVDPNQNPPAKPYCDIFLKLDVKNIELIRDYVENLGIYIEFVTSDQTDVTTIPVAKLSAHFDTPHNPLAVVERFTNKYVSREFVKKQFGTDHLPHYSKCKSIKELRKFQQQTQKPLIVKPVDAQSSRGIFLLPIGVETDQLQNKFISSLAESQCDYLIAEETITGHEITIEGLMVNSRHQVVAASSKKHFRTGIASSLDYPLNIVEEFKREIFSFHNALVEATGLKFGITHSEYIIDEEERAFYLVEIACRGGGTLISSDIIPWLSGINLYDVLYNQLTGASASMASKGQKKINKVAKLHFFEFKSGKIKSIHGLEKVREIPGVHRMEFEFKAGDEIYAASDDRGRQGFVILLADTEDAIQDILQQVYEMVTIGYEKKPTEKILTSTGNK